MHSESLTRSRSQLGRPPSLPVVPDTGKQSLIER
jgi:hypothetical protein